MSSPMRTRNDRTAKCSHNALDSVVEAMSAAIGPSTSTIRPTESEYALKLKSAPKQICIPINQRGTCSETRVSQGLNFDIPDKSWSVLYFGAKERTRKHQEQDYKKSEY